MTILHSISGKDLLSEMAPWPDTHSVQFTGLCSDSRHTKPGDLFIACAGPLAQRSQFIAQAIQQGASAILQEATTLQSSVEMQQTPMNTLIPCISIPQLTEKTGEIASRFYDYPSTKMTVIGITGTNGKTSCSHFIAHALQQAGYRCGIIGTLGHGFPNHLQPGTLTTPDAITLQHQLAILQQEGAQAVAMEVSSHSLIQQRVAGVLFNTAIFTNLTQDHLDYHGTMENYGQAKRQLFLQPNLKHAIINADDPFGHRLLEEFQNKLQCYSYSIESNIHSTIAAILAKEAKFTTHGFSAHISSPWGKGKLQQNHLLGRFNLSNLLAVLTTLSLMDIPYADGLHYLSTLATVPGRMQTFGGGKLPLVVVDYSHTPDALQQALIALRQHCHGKLWCVFGCGGNRDVGKRKLMGQVAERYSDQIILTDDNPRHELPAKIIADILIGLLCPWAAEIEHDRQAAIAHAIECATAGDVILIAGKGHENYQQIGDNKIPFNDAQQVQMHLKPTLLDQHQ